MMSYESQIQAEANLMHSLNLGGRYWLVHSHTSTSVRTQRQLHVTFLLRDSLFSRIDAPVRDIREIDWTTSALQRQHKPMNKSAASSTDDTDDNGFEYFHRVQKVTDELEKLFSLFYHCDAMSQTLASQCL